MPTPQQLQSWLEQVNQIVAAQPSSSWTIARMRLVLPSTNPSRGIVALDNLVAAGACNAQVTTASIHAESSRIHVETNFNQFELRGFSHLAGPFRILLQADRTARGIFRQRYANSLYPFQGEWEVPFEIETQMGLMIPRPTDPPVLLRSAEPGEFEIPPIGTWFEKWDPISMVSKDDPNGPTLAVFMWCEVA